MGASGFSTASRFVLEKRRNVPKTCLRTTFERSRGVINVQAGHGWE
jgi:hypothetical protein